MVILLASRSPAWHKGQVWLAVWWMQEMVPDDGGGTSTDRLGHGGSVFLISFGLCGSCRATKSASSRGPWGSFASGKTGHSVTTALTHLLH